MKNKRKNRRISCGVPIEGKEGSVFDQTRTIDISTSGIGFISQRKIPLNKKIALALELDAFGEPVLVIGQVRWVQPISNTETYRIGMTFADVPRGSKSRLHKYLKI